MIPEEYFPFKFNKCCIIPNFFISGLGLSNNFLKLKLSSNTGELPAGSNKLAADKIE